MALKEAIKEIIYINNLYKIILNKLKIGYIILKLVIYIDNNGAKVLAENPEFYKKTKHINIIYYYNREALRNNALTLEYIPMAEQLADMLIKSLAGPRLKYLIKKCGIIAV
jgi:hypothetical protein